MKLLLHLGCGPIHLEGWVNVDNQQAHMPLVCMDYLKLSCAFDENSADAIFACHTIEHLDYPADTVRFFEQTFKVLKPGGTLRVVVPDLTLIAEAYADGSDLKFIYGTEGKWFYHKENSAAERFHFFMHAWEHKMVFDFSLLAMLAEDAGFSNIRTMLFGLSPVPELCGIDRFESESVCVEAVK
jgi:predicted SAM-dependent methyltransferase